FMVAMLASAPLMSGHESPFGVKSIREEIYSIISFAFPVFAILPAFALIWTVKRWSRVGGIALGRQGIYIYGWSATSFFPWESIHGAGAADHFGPGMRLDIRERIPRADTPKPEEDW